MNKKTKRFIIAAMLSIAMAACSSPSPAAETTIQSTESRFSASLNSASTDSLSSEISSADSAELKPILSSDGKTITYGLYPQTRVHDSSLLSALATLTRTESNGWYLWEGAYYAKTNSKPNDSGYVFDDGSKIDSGYTYWFKCEPIVWNVLSHDGGTYFVLSSVLLDAHRYHYKTSPNNNYANSEIRAWLNGDFYSSAFALNDSYIQTTTVDNSAPTTGSSSNPYVSANTEDRVYLPSVEDYTNSSYGFSTSISSTSTRYCKTTDWARARGAALASFSFIPPFNGYNGYYWTRSHGIQTSDCAWVVCPSGELYFGSLGYVIYENRCVRPCLSLKLS